ncbi:conserved hypothetical protein [metagenome]|uniref:Glyoxalase/fosfomycin resistance/dioxygenase domain-containing protein n=1 Tax=metagenome TaxID=256318 RepID=A0A2P2C1G3_9ZZZZ
MASRLNPYLSFKDNARQAMEFYQSILGGELNLSTFGDFGNPDPAVADQVMHGQLETPAGYTLMAADTPPENDYVAEANNAVSLSGDDVDDLRGYFAGLSDGGTVLVPLEKQMWGDEFGMVTDKFGIRWLVNITQA